MLKASGENNCIIKKTAVPAATKEVVSELSLPDYLPDVSRLLRTSAVIGAENSYISGQSLEYDGEVDLNVIYATSDGRIKSVPLKAEFDGALPLPETDGDAEARLDLTIDSVNCRLQNPRRLSVRTKLSVGAELYTVECVSPSVTGKLSAEEEAHIRRRTRDGESFCRVYEKDENVPVSEDIEIDAGYPPIGEIVSLSLTPYIYEVRAESGKLSYRGDVAAELIYLAAGEGDSPARYAAVRNRIPISGSVDAEGVTDSFYAFGGATVTGVEYRPQANATGENRVAEVDFTYTAHLFAVCNTPVQTVTDMYSTDYKSENEFSDIELCRALRAGAFNFTSDGSAPLDEKDYDTPVASNAAVAVEKIEPSGSKAVFTGKTSVSVILTNGAGSYIGRSFEYPFRAETEVGKCRGALECKAFPSVIGVGARVDNGEIKCDAEIGISYAALDKETVRAASVCNVIKDVPKKRPSPSTIVICYPAEGDDLWSIAKRYGTTEDAVREANALSSDKLTGEALIIPIKA